LPVAYSVFDALKEEDRGHPFAARKVRLSTLAFDRPATPDMMRR